MDKSTFANRVLSVARRVLLTPEFNPFDMAYGTVPPLLLTRARSLTNFTGLVGHRSEQAG